MALDGMIPPGIGLGDMLMAQQTVAAVDPDAMKEDVTKREKPEPDDDRAALVIRWTDEVKRSKTFHKDAFDRMKEDMAFAKGEQWAGSTSKTETKYIANLVQRHIQQRVSSLYAKNPKAVARNRKRLNFQLWDGDMNALAQAAQGAAMGDPTAMQLLQEVQTVKQQNEMYRRVGQTTEILFNYYMGESEPNFKMQAKQLIRRVVTTGVGYVKLGFHRAMDKSPDVTKKISDLSAKLAVLERLSADVADKKVQESEAEFEELEMTLKALQAQPDVIISEGLTFDFPKSTAVIVDQACVQLKGFIGANWIAHEFMFTKDEIHEIYGVDVGSSAETYNFPGSGGQAASAATAGGHKNNDKKGGKHAVWEIQDKNTGTVMTICDGYPDFLEEPAPPKVNLQRFWNIFTLSFNDIEDEKDIYPPSDVRLMRSMQIEYNRSREGLREHRIANRPAYGAPKGVLEDTEKDLIANHAINEVIEFNVPPGTDMKAVLQPLGKVAIDPAVYDTAPLFDDLQKVVGAQTSDFGGVADGAATNASIAEGARMSTISSSVDDLDDLLSSLARCAGEIMLREISPETAKKIAGAGAVWPELSNQEIADEIYLEIEAGSSGRPNKAQEIANFERMAPTLLQIPGINPQWLAKQALLRMDDRLDLDDALIEGMPSMTSLNAAQPSTGDPATDPNQQGGHGGNNSARPPGQAQGPQPGMPSPHAVQLGGH